METWSCKLLSIAGRVVLIKTVVYAIILHWMQTYQIPAATIVKIEKLCANFVQRGGIIKCLGEDYVDQRRREVLALEIYMIST